MRKEYLICFCSHHNIIYDVEITVAEPRHINKEFILDFRMLQNLGVNMGDYNRTYTGDIIALDNSETNVIDNNPSQSNQHINQMSIY